MATKLQKFRATDLLYVRVGGKAGVSSLVQRYYEKMLADPDTRVFIARANMSSLRKKQALFFARALGGPLDSKSRNAKPAHMQLLPEQKLFERTATHLAVV